MDTLVFNVINCLNTGDNLMVSLKMNHVVIFLRYLAAVSLCRLTHISRPRRLYRHSFLTRNSSSYLCQLPVLWLWWFSIYQMLLAGRDGLTRRLRSLWKRPFLPPLSSRGQAPGLLISQSSSHRYFLCLHCLPPLLSYTGIAVASALASFEIAFLSSWRTHTSENTHRRRSDKVLNVAYYCLKYDKKSIQLDTLNGVFLKFE